MGNNYFTQKTISIVIVTFFTFLTTFGQANLISDQSDYAPGSTATFTGSGFESGEVVKLQVLHADESPNTGEDHGLWYVTANEFGNFVTTWHVCEDDCLGSTLRAYATGQNSDLQAYVEFTDADPIILSGGFCSGSITTKFTATVPSNTGNIKCLRLEFPAGFSINSVLTGDFPAGWSTSIGGVSVNISGGTNLSTSTTYTFYVTFASAPSGNYSVASKSGSSCPNNTSGGNATTIVSSVSPNPPTAVNYSGTYDGASHSGSATGIAGETIDWYANATGPATSVAPSGTNFGTYIAYAEARNTTTGCLSASRTQVTVNIGKANSTTVVTITGSPFTYTGSPIAPAMVSVIGAGGLNLSPTANYASNTNAGTATAIYTYSGDANHNGSSDSKNFTINKANSTTVVIITGSPFTYTGSPIAPATVSVIGAGGLNLSPTANYASNTNAGTATASYTYSGDANHNGSSDSKNFTINKANSTTVVTITGSPFTYTGSPITPATVSVTGAGGLNLTPLANYTNNTNAGTATASYVYSGDANHNGSSDSKNFTINKANATTVVTITGSPFTYTGSPITPATVSVTGAGGLNLTPLANYTNNTNAGTATASYVYAGDANYNGSSDSKNFTINKANATIIVTPYSVTYDALAHTSVGSAKGVLNENLVGLNLAGTTHTNAGTYNTDAWTFTDVTGNYNNANGTVNNAIGKADANVSVTGYTGIYDGAAHGASGSALGVLGESLSGLNLGTSYTNVPGGTAHWVFTDVTGNYTDENGDVLITINKADANVSVTGYTGIYDGAAHGASGSALGVLGESLSGLNLGSGFTNVPGGTAHWVFTDVTGNYSNQSGDVSIVINKADANVSVTGYTGIYDGAAHGASGSALGVLGESLNGLNLGSGFTNVPGGTAHWIFTDVTGNYSNQSGDVSIVINKADANVSVTGYSGIYDGAAHGASGSALGVLGESLSGLNLGSGFTNVPGGTAHWVFTDVTGNYSNQSGDVSIVINKADANVSVTGYTGIYDGAAHGASGSALGVLGESLNGLNLGSGFTNVPGGTAHWIFTDVTGNYSNQSGDVSIVINKADANVSVTGYSGIYDGAAHGASGSALGVLGESLSGLNLGSGFTNVPGGTAHWVFTDVTGNYSNQSGDVSIVINKADANVSVTGYTGIYDGAAHGASGSALGVLGESLNGLNLGSGFTNVPGGTAHWFFTDVTGNYTDENGDVSITINKADANVSVTGYSGIYDGAAHGASGTALGVLGESLSGLNLGASYTNVPGGTAHWIFTDVTGNYSNQSGDVSIVINKADANVSVTGYSGIYDGASHGASGSALGVLGESLSGLNLGSSYTNVPGGTAHWIFTDVTGNYSNQNGDVSIVINKADANVSVTGYSGIYDGAAHGASGTALGVLGESLSGLNLGASYTNVPGGTAHWVFTDVTGNYSDANGDVSITINKAEANITATPYSVTYDALVHTSAGSAKGVLNENLVGLNLAGTTHTNAGTYNADAWTFTDVTGNYNNANGTVNNSIGKANATITITPYNVTYDALSHTSTGSAKGVVNENLAGLNLTATTHTNAGTYNADAWTFTDVTGNYNNANGAVNNVIGKAASVTLITLTAGPFIYAGVSITPASVSVTGAGGLNLSPSAVYTNNINVGTATASYTYTGDANHDGSSDSKNFTIGKKSASVTPAIAGKVYGNLDPVLSGSLIGFVGSDGVSAVYIRTLGESVTGSPYTISAVLSPSGVLSNYNIIYNTANFTITKKEVVVTAVAKSKYCTQADPVLTYTSNPAVGSLLPNGQAVSFSGSLVRVVGETTGSYAINQGSVGNNDYTITYNSANLTINGIPIDASASSAPVALGSLATLKATVTPNVAGITVSFYLDDVLKGSSLTNASGLATLPISGLTTDVYLVKAIVGNGCTESNAYLVVYDLDGGFVTGGGWYMSLTGAYVPNPTLTGKANFGFVAKYKKGSTQVEGNTEFQFQSGDINFKSTEHNAMSLVVAGAQAIYKGIGTINNVPGYSFMVSAIDGDMKTNPVPDKFRIKIWLTSSGVIVYDNQLGQSENAEATTALGGGSIVIHQTKKASKGTNSDDTTDNTIYKDFSIKAYPNPSSQYFNLNIQGNDGEETEVMVYNSAGILIDQFKGKVNQEYQIGDRWSSGLYLVQIKKGTEVKTIKLIKRN